MAAASTCTFGPGAVVNVSDTSGTAALRLTRLNDAIVVRDGAGAAQNSVGSAGVATIRNTNRIAINGPATVGNDTVIVDQSQGAFAPGASLESDGISEIEIEIRNSNNGVRGNLMVLGTQQADSIRVGNPQSPILIDRVLGAINTGGTDADQDITWKGQSKTVSVFGLAGNDLITGRGNLTKPLAPIRSRVIFFGGSGNDVLVDGLATGDALTGDNDDDTLFTVDGVGGDVVKGGAGFDTATTDANDTGFQNVADIERHFVG